MGISILSTLGTENTAVEVYPYSIRSGELCEA